MQGLDGLPVNVRTGFPATHCELPKSRVPLPSTGATQSCLTRSLCPQAACTGHQGMKAPPSLLRGWSGQIQHLWLQFSICGSQPSACSSPHFCFAVVTSISTAAVSWLMRKLHQFLQATPSGCYANFTKAWPGDCMARSIIFSMTSEFPQ